MFYIKFLEIEINLTYTISWKQKFPEIQMWQNHHWLCVAWRALVKPMREYKLWFKAYTKYLSRDKHLRDSYSQQPKSPEDSVIFFLKSLICLPQHNDLQIWTCCKIHITNVQSFDYLLQKINIYINPKYWHFINLNKNNLTYIKTPCNRIKNTYL